MPFSFRLAKLCDACEHKSGAEISVCILIEAISCGEEMKLRTCVMPDGTFRYGIHKPAYTVKNLRTADCIEQLGTFAAGQFHDNRANFPAGDVEVAQADWVYEIPNALPFRGTTYIGKAWADRSAKDPGAIYLEPPAEISLTGVLRDVLDDGQAVRELFPKLPRPVLLSLAVTSTDPEDLVLLAELSCEFRYGRDDEPAGLAYVRDESGRPRPQIVDEELFEAVANNRCLPAPYREIMVLRPGAQGGSEIVGEFVSESSSSHVFEYLRRNSYIPWGHFAANMANDAVRYSLSSLTEADMIGLRHLYYQRTYVRLAAELGITVDESRQSLSEDDLEALRQAIVARLADGANLRFDATLWGWNYGFDFAPSGYRLHASHQQIHQQFALVPAGVEAGPEKMDSFACGDMVAEFIDVYRRQNGCDFFQSYLRALRSNRRIDNDEAAACSLIVHEDRNVVLFVPKAQTSQWELQLMAVRPVGNILEADGPMRTSLDGSMLKAMRILQGLGARMVTTIEYSKRFTAGDNGQHLLYSFLPKLPQSPGAFSEAQLRFINGHYPEDFAAACRAKLSGS